MVWKGKSSFFECGMGFLQSTPTTGINGLGSIIIDFYVQDLNPRLQGGGSAPLLPEILSVLPYMIHISV